MSEGKEASKSRDRKRWERCSRPFECRLAILYPFLGDVCLTCQRRLAADADNRAEVETALSGLRPVGTVFGAKVYVVYVVSTLGEVGRKLVTGEETIMGFKEIEVEFQFNPSAVGDYVMGRVMGMKAMDNKPNVLMLLVKTSRPVLDGEGAPVLVETTDSEGKKTTAPKMEQAIARVIDFDLIRAIQTEIPDFKRYDAKGEGAKFVLIECVGFGEGETAYPRYKPAIGTKADMQEELLARKGVAMVLHPRVNKKAQKSDGASTNTSSGNDDDIPF